MSEVVVSLGENPGQAFVGSPDLNAIGLWCEINSRINIIRVVGR